jgi:hypothetical protein
MAPNLSNDAKDGAKFNQRDKNGDAKNGAKFKQRGKNGAKF